MNMVQTPISSQSKFKRNVSRDRNTFKLPMLMKSALKTQSSFGYTPRDTKTDRYFGYDAYESSPTEKDIDALPTIEEMASNYNYMKNLQPFDMMDRDLRYLVEELKAQKKSKKY